MTDALSALADTFQTVPEPLRLELLLEQAMQFPPLPERYQAAREAGLGRVHECQAEVYFFPEVADDGVHLWADIPSEAPTQRALVGLLMRTYDGATPDEVAAIPDDLLRRLGIDRLLGVQRQIGFAGVLRRLKHGVAEASA